ncbi:unnamed protein product [marine sediment metagenome]|uniref:Glycosyltransferase 2-like domain-containing protein n=2 Tax=marine sediment metagenome TaxID=412755 RepID=X0Z0K7_9ZZZZ
MKHIDIVIPTRNRYEKLMRTLESISNNSRIYTQIIVDGETNTLNKINANLEEINKKGLVFSVIHEPLNKGAVYCRNSIIKGCKDGVLYATDDIIFEPKSIENAFDAFNVRFPDDDGVVGFVITKIPNYHVAGVALVGKKFLDRYPDRELFYPGYFHFSCQEVYWLASKYGKFHQEKTAVVQHYHPSFHKEEMDGTHAEARIHRKKDHALIYDRQSKGLIWGDAQ